jgi:glycosyltransferase involved in cell wall biosynthesis
VKRISVMTPCYNEEANVRAIHAAVRELFEGLADRYDYEHLFIDNASTDDTVAILKEIGASDPKLKLIVNTRNFGHIRSPHHGLLQATGDAVVFLVADLQDPPEMLREFIAKWEEGFKIVIGVKTKSEEPAVMFAIRNAYYNLVTRLSEVELIRNFTGFGLYDREVIDTFRKIDDTYPYFRGLVAEVGYKIHRIEYTQRRRARGITKNNFYTLYDLAMLGITNHSKVPLRLATLLGFATACISLVVALGYFVAKLVFWNYFLLGTAPLITGMFFFGSVQLFFIGIIGEYIASIHTQVLKRPLVIEKERFNFDRE